MPEKTLRAVLQQHTDKLLSVPGVVGTAEGRCDGKPCIKVLVIETTPDLRARVPSELDGYLVVVEVTGQIRPLDPHAPRL